MPAVITHHFFSDDLYENLGDLIGYDKDEHDAFALGCQGPDPLFFLIANPTLSDYAKLGGTLHAERTEELLSALRDAVDDLEPDQQSIGRAYVLGFLAHFMLDSMVHPLVFSQQYAYCDAGEPGLDRQNSGEVHAVIECEYDEVMLFTRTGLTIKAFEPQREILICSDQALAVIDQLYSQVIQEVYAQVVPKELFSNAVVTYRAVLALLHSPRGTKRRFFGFLTGKVKPAGKAYAMMHRPVEAESTPYANDDREPWENPFTQEASNASFADLYDQALKRALVWLPRYSQGLVDDLSMHSMTRMLNFSGEPTFAQLPEVENLQ